MSRCDYLALPVTPEDACAVGDLIEDDTLNIQVSVNEAIRQGRPFQFTKNYRITAPIVIPDAKGWRLLGNSRTKSIIRQSTDGVPIFQIEGKYVHSFEIGHLNLQYENPQPLANNEAVPIYFVGGYGSSNVYQFWTHDINVHGCRSVIGVPNTQTVLLWGFTIERIWASAFSGPFFDSPHTIGKPDCYFNNIYLQANSVDASSSSLFNCPANRTIIGTLEINDLNAPVPIYKDGGGGSLTAQQIKVEGMAMDLGQMSSDVYSLFQVSNSQVHIDQLLLTTNEARQMAIPTGKQFSIFRGKNDSGSIDIGSLKLDLDATGGGTIRVFEKAAKFSNVNDIVLGSAISSTISTEMARNIGAADLSLIQCPMIQNGHIHEVSDADYTFARGGPTAIYYQSALTADRVVTVLNNGGWYPTGTPIRIRKRGGEYVLDIRNEAGSSIAQFGASEYGLIELVYTRFSEQPRLINKSLF